MKIEINVPDEMAEYKQDLQMFFDGMVKKLYDNRHKGKWENLDVADVYELLNGELSELDDCLRDGNMQEAFWECVDAANMCLIMGAMSKSGANNPFAARCKIGQPMKFIEWACQQDVDHCLMWPFRTYTGPNNEYPSVSKNQHPMGRRVNRIVAFEKHGPPPTKTSNASHLCHNSKCVNPNHIVWEEFFDNQARKAETGSLVTPQKLSWDKVREIRRKRHNGAKVVDLADEYGVTRATMSLIVNNHTWKPKYERNGTG